MKSGETKAIHRPLLCAIALVFLSCIPVAAKAYASQAPHQYGRTLSGMVCLSVDDGYGRSNIESILKTLRDNDVHCTFFIVGDALSQNQDLWRQAVSDGNEICYHTMHHDSVSGWSTQRVLNDLNQWTALAHRVLGDDYEIPKFVRMPGGGDSQSILQLFDSMGYRVMYWDVDTYTGAIKPGNDITQYVKYKTNAGSIILTHFNASDASAMPKYIAWLKSNYTLGTLSEAFYVDKDALSSALEAAKSKVSTNYTPGSWSAANLSSAIASAQAEMDKKDTVQANVDKQAGLLIDAMSRLVPYYTGLQIASPPTRQAYRVGESFDPGGLSVSAAYSDGSKKTAPSGGIGISGYDSSKPAIGQKVTVTYVEKAVEKSASFYVDILASGGEEIGTSVYAVDRTSWLLTGVSAGTSADQLIGNLSNDAANIGVYDKNGNEYTGDTVATGMTVKLIVGGAVTDELKIEVLGDVSGDGAIDISDILYVRAEILDTYAFNAYQFLAADINRDGVIDINDILYIRSHILGTYTIGIK